MDSRKQDNKRQPTEVSVEGKFYKVLPPDFARDLVKGAYNNIKEARPQYLGKIKGTAKRIQDRSKNAGYYPQILVTIPELRWLVKEYQEDPLDDLPF